MGEIIVGIGDFKVAKGDNPIVTYALGSCVGVCLYDANGIGGMLHAMLPTSAGKTPLVEPQKYVDSGMLNLYRMLCQMGVDREHLKAKLVGGAKMFEFKTAVDDVDIGTANVLQARKSLQKLGISLVREVTGGEVGRTIRFIPANGMVMIRSTDRRTEVI